MNQKSSPTQQAVAKDNAAKQARVSGTATEHATSGTATEHAASEPDKDFRSPGKKHGTSAILAEDVFEDVIPFLVMESPAHTMCVPKEGRTPVCNTGEHFHVWCHICADLTDNHHCAAMHDACQDCRILRTILQLSRRWENFIWEQHEWSYCSGLA